MSKLLLLLQNENSLLNYRIPDNSFSEIICIFYKSNISPASKTKNFTFRKPDEYGICHYYIQIWEEAVKAAKEWYANSRDLKYYRCTLVDEEIILMTLAPLFQKIVFFTGLIDKALARDKDIHNASILTDEKEIKEIVENIFKKNRVNILRLHSTPPVNKQKEQYNGTREPGLLSVILTFFHSKSRSARDLESVKNKILFLSRTKRHPKIIDHLSGYFDSKVTCFRIITDNILLHRTVPEANYLWGYVNAGIIWNIISFYALLKINRLKTRIFRNKDSDSSSGPDFSKQILLLYDNNILKIMLAFEVVHNLLKKERPSLVVSQDDVSRLDHIFASVAKKMSIPTLCLQHGMFGNNYLRILELNQFTTMAFWGEYACRIAKNKGYAGRCAVTGYPFHDQIFNRDKIAERATCLKKQLSIPEDSITKIVTIFSQAVYEEWDGISLADKEYFIKTVITAVRNIDTNIILVIKKHPRETDKVCSKILASLASKNNILIVDDVDLFGLLSISDIVITMFSTVALEAVLFRKPAILISVGDQISYESFKYCRLNGDLNKDTEYIRQVIQNIISDPSTYKVSDFIVEDISGSDGNSSLKLSKLIQETLRSS